VSKPASKKQTGRKRSAASESAASRPAELGTPLEPSWTQLRRSGDLPAYGPRFGFANATVRDIIAVFHNDPWTSLGVREIAHRAGRRTASGVHLFVRQLESAGLLEVHPDSRSHRWPQYTANLDSPILLKLFELVELERQLAFYRRNPPLRRSLERVVNRLLVESDWRLLGVYVFGSWARGQATKDSDLDILLVFPSASDENGTLARAAERVLAGSWRPSVVVTTIGDLGRGLGNREPFHQELWRDRVVAYGESTFWQLVRRVIKPHGAK
jgi:predicted nucleotidyltransferase